jgi:PLD-like domain
MLHREDVNLKNMKLFSAAITSAVFVTIGPLSHADPAPTIHYAPAENLEHIDVALIDTARREIDLAAYVLTDWPIIEALIRATRRGVKVRIYVDGTQFAWQPFAAFVDYAEHDHGFGVGWRAWRAKLRNLFSGDSMLRGALDRRINGVLESLPNIWVKFDFLGRLGCR